MKDANIVRIPTSLEKDYFRYWFEFLRPFHKLTNREIDVMASFLQERYILSKVIFDEEVLDTVLMSEDTKRKVISNCNLKLSHFQVIMAKLRLRRLIIDGKINKKYIPNVTKDAKGFKLIIYFDFNDIQ